jgi:hypothetical protein
VREVDTAELLHGSWQEHCLMLCLPGGADLPYCENLNGKGNAFIRGAGQTAIGCLTFHQKYTKHGYLNSFLSKGVVQTLWKQAEHTLAYAPEHTMHAYVLSSNWVHRKSLIKLAQAGLRDCSPKLSPFLSHLDALSLPPGRPKACGLLNI